MLNVKTRIMSLLVEDDDSNSHEFFYRCRLNEAGMLMRFLYVSIRSNEGDLKGFQI